MIAVLSMMSSILVLWAFAWAAGLYGARLPKRSWMRLLLALLSVSGCLGIPILQVYLLTILRSEKFAHDVFIYLLVFECLPGIGLVYYATVREERAKRRRVQSKADPTARSPNNSQRTDFGGRYGELTLLQQIQLLALRDRNGHPATGDKRRSLLP